MTILHNLTSSLPANLDINELIAGAPASLWQSDEPLAIMLALAASGKFDYAAYLERNEDVAQANLDPLWHFVVHGLREGRAFPVKGGEETLKPPASALETREPALIEGLSARPAVDEMIGLLSAYDAISFDIFDTALLRRVEFPRDIFAIMALEMDWGDFYYVRSRAEEDARNMKFRQEGHREITLAEIYERLRDDYGIAAAWMEREIELEKAASFANPYILGIYRALKAKGKKLLFCSDMYLPRHVLEEMLANAGYTGYAALYLSNELKLRKGDGSMQKRLRGDFFNLKLIHIGDNKTADVDNSVAAGLKAVHYPDIRLKKREAFLNNMAGSHYRAIVNSALNNGCYAGSAHHAHGFRVGGILAAGYCQHVNRAARAAGSEKILFCGRDCFTIHKVYERFYSKLPSAYVETSRLALLRLSPARYADDILHRFLFRHWDDNADKLTLEQLLRATGFDFLVPHLEEYDINRFTFCQSAKKDVFRRFFLDHIPLAQEHYEYSALAARKYFRGAIGDCKSLLIADVGWSGTCIEALEYFIHSQISPDIKITGALICASDTMRVANLMLAGKLAPFVSGPSLNSDLHRFIFPAKSSAAAIDALHMPLEYLFQAPTGSLLAWRLGADGEATFERDANQPANLDEIEDMRRGIMDFNELFAANLGFHKAHVDISPYVAFMPFKDSLNDLEYVRRIFGKYPYDACTLPEQGEYRQFSSILPARETEIEFADSRPRILLVTPELIYAGAPNSLLRFAGVIRRLGFEPIIWSGREGPFRAEFEKLGMQVQVVAPDKIDDPQNKAVISRCAMAYCNTIVTSEYAHKLHNLLPTVWFIREASNIPDFCRNNAGRLELLQSYEDIYCVSGYARESLARFTDMPINILENCVPDESLEAEGQKPGGGDKIRFAQLGTMEYRKGYDILLKAWQGMPADYKNRSELHFAGGFINSGASYCEWLFREIKKTPGVYFHGLIQDRKATVDLLAQMDVVVVASRDESCSLVALEGAMLGRPLIVTENVGASYMVQPENGLIVETGSVEKLRSALMSMIDARESLAAMGARSRVIYEERASMQKHEADIAAMLRKYCPDVLSLEEVVVSLTSWPARMPSIMPCLRSLIAQNYTRSKLILWLAREEFPFAEAQLPDELVSLAQEGKLEICWVDGNLKSHKKYFYAMRQYPDLPVIIVDDDAVYDRDMVRNLMDSWARHPHCVSCHRANMPLFREDGSFRSYDAWIMDYRSIVDRPSMRLVPTGVGGVLYPPGALPQEAFNREAIMSVCPDVDDLWLKMMAVANGYPTVLARERSVHELVEGSQDCALWQTNVKQDGNDSQLASICEYMRKELGNAEQVIDNIRDGL